MDTLPDDLVVYIFSFLPPEVLLRSVRGVCSSWRELALHWDSWSHSRIDVRFTSNLPLFHQVARFAPRLYILSFHHMYISDDKLSMGAESLDLLAARRCPITCLEIYCTRDGHSDIISRLLNSQVQSLRYLKLIFHHRPTGTSLWQRVQALALKELMVIRVEASFDRFLFTRLGGAGVSLRRLLLKGDPGSSIPESLLEAHCRDLEWIDLSQLNCRQTIAALSSCPRLREAILPPVKEVAQLRACPALTKLTLRQSYEFNNSEVPAVCAYLKGPEAARLQSLTLRYIDDSELVADMLTALASSGRAELETFEMEVPYMYMADPIPEVERVLPKVVRGLPCLRKLTLPLGVVLEGALSAAPAPNLRVLDLSRVGCRLERPDNVKCFISSLRDLLLVHSALHVVYITLRKCCVDQVFQYTGNKEQHEFLTGSDSNSFGLYSHSASLEEDCFTCRKYYGCDWKWVSLMDITQK